VWWWVWYVNTLIMFTAAFISLESIQLHSLHWTTVARFLYEPDFRGTTLPLQQHAFLDVLYSSTSTIRTNGARDLRRALLGAEAWPRDVGPKDPLPHATTTFFLSYTPSRITVASFLTARCPFLYTSNFHRRLFFIRITLLCQDTNRRRSTNSSI